MDKIIAYVDDLVFAQQHLAPMVASRIASGASPSTYVLVACAPKMHKHITRWVSRTAQDKFRDQWVEDLFDELQTWLGSKGEHSVAVTAHGDLIRLTDALMSSHPGARVHDLRRPKFGVDLEPIVRMQGDIKEEVMKGLAVPSVVAGMGAALVLAAE